MWLLVHPIYRLAYRVRIEGREHLPEGGALLAANHESFLDIPLVSRAAAPRHVAFRRPGHAGALARARLHHASLRSHPPASRGLRPGRPTRDGVPSAGRRSRRRLPGGHAHASDGSRSNPSSRGALLAGQDGWCPRLSPPGSVGTFEAWPRGQGVTAGPRVWRCVSPAPVDPAADRRSERAFSPPSRRWWGTAPTQSVAPLAS